MVEDMQCFERWKISTESKIEDLLLIMDKVEDRRRSSEEKVQPRKKTVEGGNTSTSNTSDSGARNLGSSSPEERTLRKKKMEGKDTRRKEGISRRVDSDTGGKSGSELERLETDTEKTEEWAKVEGRRRRRMRNEEEHIPCSSYSPPTMVRREQRCHRCLGLGHVWRQCTSLKDRSTRCYRCGTDGHITRFCNARLRCPLCADMRRPAGHVLGGEGCYRVPLPGAGASDRGVRWGPVDLRVDVKAAGRGWPGVLAPPGGEWKGTGKNLFGVAE